MPLQHGEPYTEWTADLLGSLPDDGNRYEVIDGELYVTPAPSLAHQRAISELLLLLVPYTRLLKLDVLMAPADVRFSERRLVQPDLLVLPLSNGRHAKRFEDVGRLILAVEVLSPFSMRTDRFTKRELYQSERVPEYWIVDLEGRAIERCTPESETAEIMSSSMSWQPLPEHGALRIDLVRYFESVLDD